MSDYGISAELPVLDEDHVPRVIDRLTSLGVPHQCTLQDVTEEDLTEGKLLAKIPARKLVKMWQREGMDSEEVEDGKLFGKTGKKFVKRLKKGEMRLLPVGTSHPFRIPLCLLLACDLLLYET